MNNKILSIALFALTCSGAAHADKLANIQKEGVLRVGTTGDYKPFSFFDGKAFQGYDIDVAEHLAKKLDVKLELVPTTWKTLISGLEQNKYDIAMGGITRRMDRQLRAEQTQGYMSFGKCFLVAKGKSEQFDSLSKVNQASVRLGVNIGGTNETFANANLAQANFTRYENNLDVPKALARGEIDVMVTETPEALFYQVADPSLEAVRCDDPFTKGQFGYLIPKGEQRLLNTVNFFIDEIKLEQMDKVFMKNNALLEK